MKFKNVFSNFSLRLFLIIVCCLIIGEYLPYEVKALFLSLSLTIKSALISILPLLVFSLTLYAFTTLSQGAGSTFLLLMMLICCSNFFAVMFSYGIGNVVESLLHINNHLLPVDTEKQALIPTFSIVLPKIADNLTAFILAAFLGVYSTVFSSEKIKTIAYQLKNYTNWFLKYIFIPLVPLLIAGSILKTQHEGVLTTLLKPLLPLLVIAVCVQFFYIFFFYFLLNNLNFKQSVLAIKNILPAAMIGFSTMSSAAAMPNLIIGSEKNSKNTPLIQSIIPPATNSHMLGDSLAIPLMAITLYQIQYNLLPSFATYFNFAIGYVIAKFSAAGVPGGTILVMIPLLESKLGFTSEMSAAILMMYVFFDPLCTMMNVLGNGLFALVFEKISSLFSRSKFQTFFLR